MHFMRKVWYCVEALQRDHVGINNSDGGTMDLLLVQYYFQCIEPAAFGMACILLVSQSIAPGGPKKD